MSNLKAADAHGKPLACVRHPWRYFMSFYGVVDLLAVVPSYLALLVPEDVMLIEVLILRLLRVFRVFKLTAYVSEYQVLDGVCPINYGY